MIKDTGYGTSEYLLDIGVPLTQIISGVPQEDVLIYKAHFGESVSVVFAAQNTSHEMYYTLDAELESTEIAIKPEVLDVTSFVAMPEGAALWESYDTSILHGNARQFSWEEIIADGVEQDLIDPGLI